MGAQAFIPRSLAPAGLDSSRTGGGRWVEASALLLFAAATFLALALVSVEYDPSDPGLAGWDWMGEVGAFLARALVQGFGLASWLIPVELVCFGLPLLQGAQPTRVGLRVSGDTLLLVLVASLLQVACPEVEVFGRAHAGGNVGLLFGELMRGLFSAPGSFLVGFTAIGLLLISRASFSFIELTQRAEHFFAKTMAFFGRAWLRLSSAWSRVS